MQPYALAHGCDSALNLWCDHNCPHFATHGRLLARRHERAGPLERVAARGVDATADGAARARPAYRTRHVQLGEVLAACRRDSAAYDSEARFAAAAASAPCEDAAAECHLWAQYGECDANPRYMRESCRKSCRALRRRRHAAAAAKDAADADADADAGVAAAAVGRVRVAARARRRRVLGARAVRRVGGPRVLHVRARQRGGARGGSG